VMDWMWGTVLPSLQPVADKNGFGKQWREMCESRTADAADAARCAAWDAADAARCAARCAADAAFTANAAKYAKYAAADAANAAKYAAYAAAYAAAHAAGRDVWATFAPVEVLRQLIAVTDARAVA